MARFQAYQIRSLLRTQASCFMRSLSGIQSSRCRARFHLLIVAEVLPTKPQCISTGVKLIKFAVSYGLDLRASSARSRLVIVAEELPTNKPSTLCLSLDLSDAQSLTDSTFALYALVLVSWSLRSNYQQNPSALALGFWVVISHSISIVPGGLLVRS